MLRLHLILVCILLPLLVSGCLKTRSQIKTEGTSNNTVVDNEDAGQPAQPKSTHELEDIKNEVTRIAGRIDEVEHRLHSQQNTSELKDLLSRLDLRVADVEKNQLLIMSELKDVKDNKRPSTPNQSNKELLSEASQLFKGLKFEEALEKYKQILSKHSKGSEAAEAYFGIGECEFALKNFKKAIVSYSKVQEVFPKSSRISTSLYKIGLSFERLNMEKEAKGFFAELIERFPKSAEAKKAKNKTNK